MVYTQTSISNVDIVLDIQDTEEQIVLSSSPGKLQGEISFDVSSNLYSLLSFSDNNSYISDTYNYNNIYRNFLVKFIETQENGTETVYAINDTYSVLNAARSFQDFNLGNLVDYLITNLAPTPTSGRFLTEFNVPTYFIGYPFDISYIHSSINLSPSYLLSDVEDHLAVGDSTTGRILINKGGFRLLQLDINGKVISFNTISTEDVSNAIIGINLGKFIEERAVTVTLFMFNDVRNITQTKTIKVSKPCMNGVYIRWAGLLGAYNYWFFPDNQDSIKLGNKEIIKNSQYVDKIINKKGGRVLAISEFNQKVKETFDGFESLSFSTLVQMYDTVRKTWIDITLDEAELIKRNNSPVFGFTASLVKDNVNIQKR